MRNRKTGTESSSNDFHAQLLSEEQRRDKLVEDMVALTREWKEQSKVANKIIKKDVEVKFILLVFKIFIAKLHHVWRNLIFC